MRHKNELLIYIRSASPLERPKNSFGASGYNARGIYVISPEATLSSSVVEDTGSTVPQWNKNEKKNPVPTTIMLKCCRNNE